MTTQNAKLQLNSTDGNLNTYRNTINYINPTFFPPSGTTTENQNLTYNFAKALIDLTSNTYTEALLIVSFDLYPDE